MTKDDKALTPLPILLLRARLVVAARYNHALRRHGLTEQQWRVLASLSRQEADDVMTLAKRVDLLSPSVSRILRDLEARGFIRRTTAEADARRTVAIVTPGGRDLIAETVADLEPVHALIRDCVGEEEVKDLQIRLARLIEALDPKEDISG